jgi:2-C-methyl-D-erythritol 2,4-cyclodiphosphate synthase
LAAWKSPGSKGLQVIPTQMFCSCHNRCSLGAAGLGDIGRHFPDNDQAYRDISSLLLLEQVREMLSQSRVVMNIDAVIMAQNPKMLPYIPEMDRSYFFCVAHR